VDDLWTEGALWNATLPDSAVNLLLTGDLETLWRWFGARAHNLPPGL
jgi:hypothetical protein